MREKERETPRWNPSREEQQAALNLYTAECYSWWWRLDSNKICTYICGVVTWLPRFGEVFPDSHDEGLFGDKIPSVDCGTIFGVFIFLESNPTASYAFARFCSQRHACSTGR